ncbi:MAG: tRNA lysidine(34) synthetase TilS, partial [Limisphaerales bacterium]
AVSGGVDSMALLHILHLLAPEYGWRLTVAHFNHKLRGRASDADAKLVLETAKKMGLRFIGDAGDVKAHAAKSGLSIEMAARELRHAFLARTARKLKIKTVALAHHADDQVELFFLRLFRGTSIEGLAGMRWRSTSPVERSIHLVRPLLNVSRTELEAFAREQWVRWCEDKTNLSIDFLRNRIRRELIPLLEKHYQPGVRKNVLRLAELLRAESDFLAEATTDAISTRRAFEQLPTAIQRRVLQQQFFELGLSADFKTIELLRLNSGKVVEVDATTRLKRDEHGRVHLVKKTTAQFSVATRTIKLKATVTTSDFGNRTLTFRIMQQHGAKLAPRAGTESFDADKVGRVITLRHWQPGDRFQPIGSRSSRKLQDMFVDLKVAQAERHTRVIATTAEGEIFWVEGLRIGEKFKLSKATTRRLVVQWKSR